VRLLIAVLVLLADATPRPSGFDPANCGLLRTVAPQGREILALAFSPDGRLLAAGCADGSVRLIDTTTWRPAERWETPGTFPKGLAFSPDGKTLAVGTADGKVRLSGVRSGGKDERVLGAHAPDGIFPAFNLSFSPDGKTLLSVASDDAPRAWDLSDAGREVRVLRGHAGPVTAGAISRDGRRAVTVGAQGPARLWRTDRWEVEKELQGDGRDLYCAAFSRDGRRVAAGTRRAVVIWSADSGKSDRTFIEGFGEDVMSVAFTPDDRYLIASDAAGALRVCDAATGKDAAYLRHHAEGVAAIAFHPDGRTFASAGQDRQIKVWGHVPGGMAKVKGRGFLGIRVQERAGGGVMIVDIIAGTAAERAGLQAGEAIRKVDGAEVNNSMESIDAISSHFEGEEVEFVIERGGQTRTVRVRLGKRPAEMDR
jgi:WD40 repeat protein